MVYTISRQSRDAERMRQMTETKRLYYEDVYKKEFTAKVLECREAKKGFHIILDESAFTRRAVDSQAIPDISTM